MMMLWYGAPAHTFIILLIGVEESDTSRGQNIIDHYLLCEAHVAPCVHALDLLPLSKDVSRTGNQCPLCSLPTPI
jgi:hypothetical protein